MDHLRAIRTFIRVAERGSFTAAAADLGLSHGMASAIVKDLEARLGVELIRRTTRRMALTEEGQSYLSIARRVVEELDDAEEQLSAVATEARGSLVVQAPVAFSRIVLAPSLGAFLAKHTALRLSLLSRDRFADLVAEQIDLLIYTGALADSSLVARPLGQFPIVTVAAPSYLARRGEPSDPDGLQGHDLINIVSATSGRPLDWRFGHQGKTELRPIRTTLAFESSEAAIAAAASGAGICQNISYAVADHIAAGRLVPILNAWRDPGPTMQVVTRPYARAPARIRFFVSHVMAVARARRDRDRAVLGEG